MVCQLGILTRNTCLSSRSVFALNIKSFLAITMSGGKHLDTDSEKPLLPDDGVLRLYSMRFCPYAQRVHLILSAKNIPHHIIYINLANKPKWLTDFSKLGKVPALQLAAEKDQPSLIESLIIADYLDEKYPEVTLHPKDPLQKAQDRIFVERFSAVTGPIYKILVHNDKDSLTDLVNGLDIYEAELLRRGTPYFAGDKPGMLDYMIWPWIERTAMLKYLLPDKYELDKERFVNLLKWHDLMIKDRAVQSFYLDGETHAKFMKTRNAGNANYDMLVVTTTFEKRPYKL